LIGTHLVGCFQEALRAFLKQDCIFVDLKERASIFGALKEGACIFGTLKERACTNVTLQRGAPWILTSPRELLEPLPPRKQTRSRTATQGEVTGIDMLEGVRGSLMYLTSLKIDERAKEP